MGYSSGANIMLMSSVAASSSAAGAAAARRRAEDRRRRLNNKGEDQRFFRVSTHTEEQVGEYLKNQYFEEDSTYIPERSVFTVSTPMSIIDLTWAFVSKAGFLIILGAVILALFNIHIIHIYDGSTEMARLNVISDQFVFLWYTIYDIALVCSISFIISGIVTHILDQYQYEEEIEWMTLAPYKHDSGTTILVEIYDSSGYRNLSNVDLHDLEATLIRQYGEGNVEVIE